MFDCSIVSNHSSYRQSTTKEGGNEARDWDKGGLGLAGIGGRPEIRKDSRVTREELRGFVVGHRVVDDDVLPLLPVDGCCDLVLVAELESINGTDYFVKVSSHSSRIRESQANDLLGVDNEDSSDSERQSFLVNVGGILLVKHVVQRGHLAIGIGNNREGQVSTSDIVDILNPLLVAAKIVCRETDDFDVALLEVFRPAGYFAQLCGAHRSEIGGMREEDGPAVANPVVELDRPLSRLSGEVGGDRAKSEGRHSR